jgi:endonuclease/exonuclease/phosphatase family metal-dependent hydrolase
MRALTYNLYFGGRDRLDAIHRVLAPLAPDLAALTEADDEQVVNELAERLGLTPLWARGSGDRHIALLTRYRVRAWHIYNQKPLTQAALEATLDLPSFGPLTVYSVHLLPYLLLPVELRRAQAVGALLAHAARAPGPRLIMGDLNAIAPGDRVLQSRNPDRMRRVQLLQANLIFYFAIPRLTRAGYVDCFRKLHLQDDGFTWHTGNPTTRYDYVFADQALALRLRACRVADDLPGLEAASDHYPLVADFDLE